MDIDFDHLAPEITKAVDNYHKLSADIDTTLGYLDYPEFLKNILFEFIYDNDILNRIRKAYEETVEELYT
jgi:hypothetical protein